MHGCKRISILLYAYVAGVIQPITEISRSIKIYNQASKRKIYIHTDAAQAIGKIPVCVLELGVDYLTMAGHKFYGPRIGALYVKNLGTKEIVDCAPLKPLILGGGQERGYRSGTENTAMIAGFGKACQLVTDNINSYHEHMLGVRTYLELQLDKVFGCKVSYNGKSETSTRLPNTCNISISGAELRGSTVLEHCQLVVAGVGAACHSQAGTCQGSPILIASGIPKEVAANAIRLSVGRETNFQQIELAVADIHSAVNTIIPGFIPSYCDG